jgi:diguanylate cyclase (GGDEF)-like protein
MRQTDQGRTWVDHSQAVLSNLQTQTQRLDRVDLNLELYAATGDRARLTAAETPLSNLNVDQIQLEQLVKDNQSQARHAQDLKKAVQRLNGAVDSIIAGANMAVPDKQILTCRDAVNILQQEERSLLEVRAQASKDGSYRSFLLSAAYLGISLAIVIILFLFLFRDAIRRRADEKILSVAKGELETTVRKLTENAEESRLMTSARDEMQLCMTSKQAHESTVRHLELLLPGTSGATLVINNSRRMVEIAARWGDETALLDGFSPEGCCGLRVGKARWRKPGESELDCTHFLGKAPENYLCVPLAAHGETQGFVFVCCGTPESLALAEKRALLIQQMAELASLSIASLNLKAKLEMQSIRDGLTGLFNRNFMEIALERELHRAARQGNSLAVMMLDVDHFKTLNDTFGHEAGDVVLREVAECFRRSLREEDVICRYGGEEFVVIMPDATEETATRRAETIRNAVSEIRTHLRGELVGAITVSVGIAMYPDSGKDGGNLIQLADGAMYRAKHAGRNQVVLEKRS